MEELLMLDDRIFNKKIYTNSKKQSNDGKKDDRNKSLQT